MSRRLDVCETVREPGIEAPQRFGIIPAVIEEERIECNAALLVKFCTECIDRSERVGFGVLIEVTDIVPGVVVQESAIRVRTFAFDVCEEIATQLPWMCDADDGAEVDRS